MSWRVIARTDMAETVRPRSVKLLLGLPVATILLGAYVYPVLGSDPITTARFTGFISGWLTPIVSLVGVLLGYNAVVGKRESGAILLSLSLPHSRSDVVFGTLVSRAGLLGGVLVGALALGAGLVVYPFGSFTPLRFTGFVLLTAAFGVVWIGLGVAASLSVATKKRAFVVAFGLFFLFTIVWDGVASALELGLTEVGLASGDNPAPVEFLLAVEPGRVFQRVIDGFLNPGASVDGAWYLSEWLALGLLALWLVVPVGLAYHRFNGSDLS